MLILQRYEEALASVEEAIRLAPHLDYPYDTQGDTLLALERYEEALAAFEQAITRKPENARYQLHRKQALQALGRASGNTP